MSDTTDELAAALEARLAALAAADDARAWAGAGGRGLGRAGRAEGRDGAAGASGEVRRRGRGRGEKLVSESPHSSFPTAISPPGDQVRADYLCTPTKYLA